MTKQYFSAARRGDLDAFKRELNSGTKITAVDVNDQTALHIVAGAGHLNIVEYILLNHPNADIINDSDPAGNTALHLASTQAIYNLLIEHGATIAENNIGELPQFAQTNQDTVNVDADSDSDGTMPKTDSEEYMTREGTSVAATIETASSGDNHTACGNETVYASNDLGLAGIQCYEFGGSFAF